MAEPGCSIISFAMQNWYFKLILAIETLSGDRLSNVLQVLGKFGSFILLLHTKRQCPVYSQ